MAAKKSSASDSIKIKQGDSMSYEQRLIFPEEEERGKIEIIEILDLSDNDEISAEEEGFLLGYYEEDSY